MKKLIMLSAITFVFATVVTAQTDKLYVKDDISTLNRQKSDIKKEKHKEKKELRKLKGGEVSEYAKQQFSSDFADITDVQWERTANFDEATFTKDGQVMTAFYDADAALVGTTANKIFSDLPAAAQETINDQYKDYSVGDILFFDDNELNETDMMLYNLQFEDEDSYFIELKKDNKKIVLQVSMEGNVSYYTRLN